VGRFRRAADRTDDFSFVTPKLGVVRRYEDGRVWLNLSRGARPPQVSDLYALQTTQTPGGQKAETIDSAEIGWRGKLGPATVELVAYNLDKRDTAFRNADGFTVTGAKTRHQGVELSGDIPFTKQFSLRGWVTNSRQTYRFSDPSTRAGEAIRSGDRVDSAPDWLWNVSAVWSPRADLEAELEWLHVGEYFTNAANTRSYPGHDLANLRLGYRFDKGLEARFTVRNIANEAYAERADFAFGNDRYFPGEGRAVTVGFAWTGE
jgi:outer membrane receptor protein involved in Fe transport